ncbi:MAG TPA: metallophosphoesterase [Gordonia polyisoprenivorans]|uniref:Metallophosphoesterase n=1 Tax=Gordonia polyisoprenivorans TaxID=84595 RepID=A0A846WKC5_9ACTN|nr:metallophosphoesterase [Gordonia polyisoprenivorans]MBE7191290.1 metallophosphoesterase [Gordonia polyisoprenivorans]NKY00791.1 metallophosphoesterase [Gordonia polyisoprenivorans]OZC33476.1 metallophosphoesterase [Gordonia polyisoprenivorans]QUD82277.1 metallophosphoesterase [Gordonia polyisoprenivorans]UZF56893.1 metallophosphoesterase [Gordonia polyisoprenivorans]
MFVVAHISDLHFNGTRFNRARIESTLSYLNARADGIDALLVTGDIADEGTPREYVEAYRVLDSPLPTLVTVGNHDLRENYSEVLGNERSTAPVNSSLLVDDVLLLSVDSSIPGRNDGYLDDETLTWMSAQIDAAGADTRVLVAFHHPPVTIGMTFMDTIRQTGEERLAELVATHPNIVGFVCGHAHSACVTRFADRPLAIAPGVASTLNLPFEGTEIINRGQPPGIAFHLIDGDRLITHFRSVMF